MDTVHPIYLILTICAPQVVHMFNKVLKIPIHVLHPLLPPPVSHTQRYGLRPRVGYMTGLYQRKAQTLLIVTSSSECYI